MRAVLLTCFILTTTAYAQGDLLNSVRKNIGEVFTKSETCESLYTRFTENDISNNRLLLGYQGALELGMARHNSNPFKKMSYFSSGKEHLEEAIKRDTTDIELRFLRLTIQVNLPTFLGYSDAIESDHHFVTSNLKETQDALFTKRVNGFLKAAKEQGKL